ncbi:hypothetical protein HY213_00225 [Candidatus Peregrinibacteria bacterium]|nr:hypothetical protein [Candidatus Peregrinibacteria bacterium]
MPLGFSPFVDHIPGRPVHNKELPYGDIERRTGVHSRAIANPDETVEEVAVATGWQLLRSLGIKGKDCGGMILSSCSTIDVDDTARQVATRLGIPKSTAFGVYFCCSGFPAAVERALPLAASTQRPIVIVLAEVLSKIVNWADQSTAILFGDRGAATLLDPNGISPVLDAYAEGFDDEKELAQLRTMDAVDEQGRSCRRSCIQMNGHELFRIAPAEMVKVMEERCEMLGMSRNDIRMIVHHQANARFIQMMEKRMRSNGWDVDNIRIVNEIANMGNVASCSIPAALAHVQDQIPVGTLVSCPTVGAGPGFKKGMLSRGHVLFAMGSS